MHDPLNARQNLKGENEKFYSFLYVGFLKSMKLEQFYNNIIDKVTFLLSYTHTEKTSMMNLEAVIFFLFPCQIVVKKLLFISLSHHVSSHQV